LDHEQLKAFVIEKVEDLKGRDIIDLDVAENVVVEAKRAGTAPLSIEGRETGDWVLVDLGDVVLHVMEDEARNFYQLEKLWG
jgi:ribosome-associated protein